METIVSKAWPEWAGTLRRRSGGWNNTTYFVESQTKRGVLRIYDTHKDKAKIEFEHAVLQQLGSQNLPFKVPVPVSAVTGETMYQINESGKFACLFRYIEGDTPKEEASGYAESFGEAAGILSAVLADINPGLTPVYRPYYELRTSYPLCSTEVIRELCLHPPEPFRELGMELEMLYKAYENITDSLHELAELPHQLVHGDLNASNLLVQSTNPSEVAALLDFEFCTYDLRVMEPAVILSGLLGHPEDKLMIRKLCRGFSRSVRLSPAEISAIPVLMLLRKIDVFLHFVTRFLEGTDESGVLHEQTRLLSADLIQLSAGTAEILAVLREEQE
ncbi:Homoserine kinase [Paenibacillus auburnensis]|uniref:Homoserine kinase n=1 Tax=Paenibacillus auburnensis TaxID=2905649 RepID=A0ABN8FYI0_9BACL|nr:phosphotransferase [Paenibacillus auburnensis]CAH1191176.1 Homoserine kinase [Paenibacillus auburnensis]